MEMKYKVGIAGVAVVTAFAAGRYSAPESVRTVTKTVTIEAKHEDKNVDEVKNKHKKTIVKTIRKPDGSSETTKTITDESTSDKKTDQKTDTDAHKAVDTDVTQERGNAKLNLSALGGYSLTSSKFIYGLSVTKSILGPITGGIWGLSQPSFGLSLGLNF